MGGGRGTQFVHGRSRMTIGGGGVWYVGITRSRAPSFSDAEVELIQIEVFRKKSRLARVIVVEWGVQKKCHAKIGLPKRCVCSLAFVPLGPSTPHGLKIGRGLTIVGRKHNAWWQPRQGCRWFKRR